MTITSFYAQADLTLSSYSFKDNKLTLNVESEVRSSMCPLTPVMVNVSRPQPQWDNENSEEKSSFISVNFETDLMSPCMMAFGPHRGSVTFDVEQRSQLPKLLPGEKFKVIINDVLQTQEIVAK